MNLDKKVNSATIVESGTSAPLLAIYRWRHSFYSMGIESTYRVSRRDAISMLQQKQIEVFESDSNERLAYELYQAKESDFENYEVVDFDEENEPEDDKWYLWKYGW